MFADSVFRIERDCCAGKYSASLAKMEKPEDQGALSLYAAIAWALHLADVRGESLINAFLADALHLAEQITGK
jgi:hypothetical protein